MSNIQQSTNKQQTIRTAVSSTTTARGGESTKKSTQVEVLLPLKCTQVKVKSSSFKMYHCNITSIIFIISVTVELLPTIYTSVKVQFLILKKVQVHKKLLSYSNLSKSSLLLSTPADIKLSVERLFVLSV